jgi:hypothetical protein
MVVVEGKASCKSRSNLLRRVLAFEELESETVKIFQSFRKAPNILSYAWGQTFNRISGAVTYTQHEIIPKSASNGYIRSGFLEGGTDVPFRGNLMIFPDHGAKFTCRKLSHSLQECLEYVDRKPFGEF